MRETAPVTSGICNRRRSTSMVRRVLSLSEMEGAMVRRKTRVPSCRAGVNSDPRRGKITSPISRRPPAEPSAQKRWATKRVTMGRYAATKRRIIQPSLAWVPAFVDLGARSSRFDNTGARNRAKINEPNMAMATV